MVGFEKITNKKYNKKIEEKKNTSINYE